MYFLSEFSKINIPFVLKRNGYDSINDTNLKKHDGHPIIKISLFFRKVFSPKMTKILYNMEKSENIG